MNNNDKQTAAVSHAANDQAAANNQFELLESGEQFFPSVWQAIAQAQREILIETFILFDDKVGRQLQQSLIAAAQRGVKIDLTVDGYGSPDLSPEFIRPMTAVGIRLHVFDPHPRLLGLRTHIFRRLHRKIVAIDGRIAYVGGINYAVDQLACATPAGKLDFSLKITGPLAAEIHQFAVQQAALFMREASKVDMGRRDRWWSVAMQRRRRRRLQRTSKQASAAEFVIRDNQAHKDDIEKRYRVALRAARREIIICNAYFFPGYHLLRDLRRAARRGVSVQLILQGEPDMPTVKTWEKFLYEPLLSAGVRIYEYLPHPLHAKVAVVDGEWSTVGSSNLDPLSLALNLEANVMAHDHQLSQTLRNRLAEIIRVDCRPVTIPQHGRSGLRMFIQTLAYHCTRHFPIWAGWLPAHQPKLLSIDASSSKPRSAENIFDWSGTP